MAGRAPGGDPRQGHRSLRRVPVGQFPLLAASAARPGADPSASTGTNEPAYFLLDGDISFSRFFWGGVSNGSTVWKAFYYAKKAVWLLSQQATTAQLDDSGNGVGNEKPDGRWPSITPLGPESLWPGTSL